MTDLMKELMAEAERVKKLETEVKQTETNLNNQIGLARSEKLKEMVEFINEMNDVFTATCPGELLAVITSGQRKCGNHTWNNSLQFGKQFVWLGVDYLCSGFSSNYPVGEHMLEHKDFSVESFVDNWTDETRRFTEKEVANGIRKILAMRIEKSTADLKKVNDKHSEYFGTEG